MTAARIPLGIGPHGPSPLGLVVLVVVASAVATATLAIAGKVSIADARAPVVDPNAPPSAAEFADEFVGVTNEYARAHGDSERLAGADCVQASSGHYMCSYAVKRPGRAKECHVMQAVWTPGGDSSFEVTLSGRAGKCGSLEEAVRSLS